MAAPDRTPEERRETTRQVMVALRRIFRAVDQHSRVLMQRYGLTGPQLTVLKEISELEPLSLGDLARAVHISQATLTGIVDRLEHRDMVLRQRDPSDRRRVMVASTPAAAKVLASAPPLLHDSFVSGFSALPEWEQTHILASLQRLVALMEAREIPAGPILAAEPLDAESDRE